MSLRIALVGCGKIADGHVEEIQKMPEKARVVAVCDRELLMAEQLATRYKVPAFYDSFEKMLEKEKPDVVHVTTPPQSHLALAQAAAAAGCHLYVEKPLALNAKEAEELIATVERAKLKLTIGYSMLFDPPAEDMRRLIKEGLLGDPIHVESFYGYNLSGAFGAALMNDPNNWVHRLPGKLFHNVLDHVLYRITEFVDDDNPYIWAKGFSLREKRFGDHRDDMQDELRIGIVGERTTAYGTVSSHARPVGNFVRVYGTKNTMHVDYSMRTVTLENTPKLPGAIGRLTPPFQMGRQYSKQAKTNFSRFLRYEFHFFAGMNKLISRFYDCILNDSEPPISYRDMQRISTMMDEIFRQVQQGGVPSR